MAMMRRRLFLCFARWILALASNSLGFPFISGCSDLLRTPISSVIGGATGLTCLTGLPASPSLPAAVCLGPSCLVPGQPFSLPAGPSMLYCRPMTLCSQNPRFFPEKTFLSALSVHSASHGEWAFPTALVFDYMNFDYCRVSVLARLHAHSSCI